MHTVLMLLQVLLVPNITFVTQGSPAAMLPQIGGCTFDA